MKYTSKPTTTGILTLSSAENYGAVLQCYSLCEKLNEMGHDTLIINYYPDFIIGRYWWIPRREKRTLIDTARDIAHFPDTFRKKMKYYSFRRRYLRLTKRKYIRTFDDNTFFRIIVGSDQVWNTELTGKETGFFLPGNFSIEQRNSYAASLGKDEIFEEEIPVFSMLSSFGKLSVRECHSVDELKKINPKLIVSRNIDPVFLHDRFFWERICKKPYNSEKYILIYDFVTTDKAIEIAYKIRELYNYKIVHISEQFRSEYEGVRTIRGAGPRDFLTLICNSSYVITDSFHGMAFSIVFCKPFNVIPYPGTESRMTDLLNILGLSDRIVKGDTFSTSMIDYKEANKAIKREQENATSYLESIYDSLLKEDN